MTQIVIGVFDTPDTAYQVEETLMDQEGLDESCFHVTAQEGGEGQIRSFLSELFGPENDQMVAYYAERIVQGGALLSVDLPDDIEIQPIQETMLNAGATDLNAKPAQQGIAGGSGEQSQAIPVIQEEMEVGKREAAKGSVRVTSSIEETPVQQDINLKEEKATITRRPVDRPAEPEDLSAQGERSVEVEETTERPVISKSARVVEEIEVGKETSERTERVEDTVRHTEVNVEKEPPAGSPRKGRK